MEHPLFMPPGFPIKPVLECIYLGTFGNNNLKNIKYTKRDLVFGKQNILSLQGMSVS